MVIVPFYEKFVDLVEFPGKEVYKVKKSYVFGIVEILGDPLHVVAASPGT